MTPTEQDKELREKIQDYAIDFHNSYRPNYPTPDLDTLMQLITADRRRVELKARLDELNNVRDMYLSLVTHYRVIDRISELKQELEKL